MLFQAVMKFLSIDRNFSYKGKGTLTHIIVIMKLRSGNEID